MVIDRKPKPKIGDEKTVKKFLLIPRFTETKIYWLCTAELTYEMVEFDGYEGDTIRGWNLIYIEVC